MIRKSFDQRKLHVTVVTIVCILILLPILLIASKSMPKDDPVDISPPQSETATVPSPSESAAQVSSEEASAFLTASEETIYIPDMEDFYRGKNLKIEHIYSTDISRGGNHYWIDDAGILWGVGTSEYGQLGELREDLSLFSEPVKIAENVIHVDFSGEYFMIFLTADHRLYGMGGNAAGILQASERTNLNSTYINVATEPVLLLKGVAYARCGYTTIITLQENGNVFLLGNPDYVPFHQEEYMAPRMIMDNARYVTSFFSTYAVIDEAGDLYTWGDNRLGQCGYGTFSAYVSNPQKIAEDVDCAWLGQAGFDYTDELSAKERLIVLNNDGSVYACGQGVGAKQSLQTDPELVAEQQPVKATHTLLPVTIEEYVLPSLKTVELGWSEQQLLSFLKEYPLAYTTGHTVDEGYLYYWVYDVNWVFCFNEDGLLAEISSLEDDELEEGRLRAGISYEAVLNAYGYDYREDIDEYYRLLIYTREDYLFKVTVYDDIGCGKFSKTLKNF